MFYISLMGNHLAKTCNRYTKHREKGIQAYLKRKSSNHKGKEQEKKKGTKELQKSQVAINRMAISTYLSTITLSVNRFNSSVKRCSRAEWIKNQHPSLYCLQETHFSCKDKHTHWKRRNGKWYSMQMDTKETWGSYACSRQNRLYAKDCKKSLYHIMV